MTAENGKDPKTEGGPPPAAGEIASPRALMVLVVDDEPGFRRMLEWELSSRGMKVETAENGAEGVRMAEKQTFDVIITDITMPEMDGLKLLQEIKRSAPGTEVIVATGFGAVETAVFAMQKGAFDFVLKPYDLEHLMRRVKDAVDRLSRCESCGRVNHGKHDGV
jgi:two-component system, NtrC family, response regulator GlrR